MLSQQHASPLLALFRSHVGVMLVLPLHLVLHNLHPAPGHLHPARLHNISVVLYRRWCLVRMCPISHTFNNLLPSAQALSWQVSPYLPRLWHPSLMEVGWSWFFCLCNWPILQLSHLMTPNILYLAPAISSCAKYYLPVCVSTSTEIVRRAVKVLLIIAIMIIGSFEKIAI